MEKTTMKGLTVFRGMLMLAILLALALPVSITSTIAPSLFALALLAWLPYVGNLARRPNFWRDELGATSAYAGKTMGSGAPIPLTASGAPDINAIVGQMVDRGMWYYYDTLKITPGTTVSATYKFFATASGQPDPYNGNIAKTDIETNLPGQGGSFPPPYDLILNNLMFKFTEDCQLYDIIQFVKYSWFEFKILEKTFFKGHLWRHPAGAGITGMTTKGSQAVWTNGIPAPGAVYGFGNWAKYIAPQMTFSVTINFPETLNNFTNSTLGADASAAGQSGTALPTLLTTAQGGNGITLICGMNGLTDRAVQ